MKKFNLARSLILLVLLFWLVNGNLPRWRSTPTGIMKHQESPRKLTLEICPDSMDRSLEPGKADKWLEKINKYSKKIQSAPAAAREFGTPKWIWSFCGGYIYIYLILYIYIHVWYMYIYIYTHVYTPFIWINIGSQGAGMFTLIWRNCPICLSFSAPLNRDVIINSCYIFDICILHILSYSIHLPKDCWCSENKN